MIGTSIISLILIGLSGLLLDLHRRSWRAAQNDTTLKEGDKRFARSQYRRRTQASGIIGTLGVAIGVYPLVPHEPLAITLYLFVVTLACLAILLLAALDAWATRQNFVRLRSEHLAAQVKLVREIRQDNAQLRDG
ncbi:MAG TPA: hypothetical protein VHE81_15390 [Lacipirellulaceae bacterium]|nr:hypothetical protein [Lacipirellulaceae bacterium]